MGWFGLDLYHIVLQTKSVVRGTIGELMCSDGAGKTLYPIYLAGGRVVEREQSLAHARQWNRALLNADTPRPDALTISPTTTSKARCRLEQGKPLEPTLPSGSWHRS